MSNKSKYVFGIIAILVAIIIAIGASVGSTYNSIVQLQVDIDTQFANIETKLQRRYDLIPNLVNSAKGVMANEKDIFVSIANARAALSGANTTNEKIEASNQLEGALSRLLVIHENYPELKSDKQVTAVMDELTGTENRISVERDRFNKVVGEYNKKIKTFPTNLIANIFGFEQMNAFKAVDEAQSAPVVNFD